MSDGRTMEMLGTPGWQICIVERGGTGPRIPIPFDGASFSYALNDTSSATVKLPVSGTRRELCCDLLNISPVVNLGMQGTDTWSHELAFYDDTNYLAWAGPLRTISLQLEEASLGARDLTSWFERRHLHRHDRIWSGDLASIYERIVEDAMEEDNSPNISVSPTPVGIHFALEVVAADWPKAADLLRTLSDTGLDFTTIGRTILTGGVELTLPDTLPIWDPVARLAGVERNGDEMGTLYVLTGELKSERVNEHVGGVDAKYGLLEILETDLDLRDGESAREAAISRYEFVRVPPNYITVDLTPQGPSLKHLIPGTHCDVRLSGRRLGCGEIIEEMRLQGVDVNIVGNEQGQETKVSLRIVPLGRTLVQSGAQAGVGSPM